SWLICAVLTSLRSSWRYAGPRSGCVTSARLSRRASDRQGIMFSFRCNGQYSIRNGDTSTPLPSRPRGPLDSQTESQDGEQLRIVANKLGMNEGKRGEELQR